MAERTSYAPGTPSWVDVGVPDAAAATAFYGALFGWTAETPRAAEADGYGMFCLRNRYVAGLGPLTNAAMAPTWNVYVTVGDADGTAAIAEANGASILVAPLDVLEAGRMAVIADPLGTVFSIWQPNTHIGAQLVNEPNSFVWNELASTDLARSCSFYQAVFGWQQMHMGEPHDGTIFTLDGDMVCGAHTVGAGEFASWSVWFSVADCDASALDVVELGGTVLVQPTDMSFGRGAVVTDPWGAVFCIGKVAG